MWNQKLQSEATRGSMLWQKHVIWKGLRMELNQAVTNEMSLKRAGSGVSFRQTLRHQTHNFNPRLQLTSCINIWKRIYIWILHSSKHKPILNVEDTVVINLKLQQTWSRLVNVEVIPQDVKWRTTEHKNGQKAVCCVIMVFEMLQSSQNFVYLLL